MAKYRCTGCGYEINKGRLSGAVACEGGFFILIEPKPKKPKFVWVLEMENEGVYGIFKSKTGAEAAMKLGQAQWPDDTFNRFKMLVED